MSSNPQIASPRLVSGDEPHIRPKVLRRPASLSHKQVTASEEVMDEPKLNAPNSPPAGRTQSATPTPGWQEDGRFGLALIVIVALVNLLLALILPSTPRTPAPSVLQRPAATSTEAAQPVQVFSDPEIYLPAFDVPAGESGEQ